MFNTVWSQSTQHSAEFVYFIKVLLFSLFFTARTLTLFALIPMPTIRSLLSKQIRGSSYGMFYSTLNLLDFISDTLLLFVNTLF